MPVETFRRLIWMNDRLDVHSPVGGTGLRPGDCRWMASRFCTAALLSLSLSLFLSSTPSSSFFFSYSDYSVWTSWFESREIASRTVVLHRLIRGRTEDWRSETPRWRSPIFNSFLGPRGSRGRRVQGGLEFRIWNRAVRAVVYDLFSGRRMRSFG